MKRQAFILMLTLSLFAGKVAAQCVDIGPVMEAICQGGTSAALGGSSLPPASSAVWSDGGAGGTFLNNTGSTPETATYTAASNSTTPIILTLTSSGGSCGGEFATKQIVVTPLPDIGLGVGGTGSICSGTGTNITVAASVVGTSYQLRNDAGDINVGSPVAGTGSSINLPTGNLTATTTYNVFATLGLCSAQLTETEVITINPIPAIGLGVGGTGSICSGNGTNITVAASVVGTSYQLRNDAGDINIGSPVSGTGSSINLPTGNLTATTTFNVFATLGLCSAQLTETEVITINPLPAIGLGVGGTGSICSGTGTNITVAASVVGTSYQLRNDAGDINIGSPVSGTGSSINLPTGNLTATTTFNVFATLGICSAQLIETEVVTVNASPTAPLSGTPTQPTCAVPTGSVVLSGLPAGNWTLNPGAITGSTASTTISFLAAGTYTYIVTNSSGCISTGTSVTINAVPTVPSAPTASVTFQPTCAVPTGTIVVTGPLGAYEYSIDLGVYQAGPTFAGVPSGSHILTTRLAASTTCVSGPSGTLTVNAQPPTPNITNQTTSILSGPFTVTPGGVPLGTTYTWTAPTYTGGVTGGVAQAIPQANISGTLTIPFGIGTATYTVTPTLEACIGATFTVTVTVTSTCVPVTIGTQPADNSMCTTSGSASFTVVAAGTAPFVYQWQFNNGVIWETVTNGTPAGASYTNATTATLSVTGITTVGSRQYRCYITNCSGGKNAPSAAATLKVNALPTPTLSSSDGDNIFCKGSSITFTAEGGTIYNFRVGVVSVQNGSMATYTTNSLTNGQVVSVIVTNANGCSATSTGITNFVNTLPFIIVTTPPVCAANLTTYSLVVTVGSGAVTSTSGTVTNTGGDVWSITGVLSGTNINVTVTDENSCENIIGVTAPNCSCSIVPPAPVSGGDKSYCATGIIPTITATVLTGEAVDWYNSSSGVTPLVVNSLSYTPSTAGTYYATARNTTTNCVSITRTAVTVTMNTLPIPALTSSDLDNVFCAGTSVIFTAGGGTSYNFRVGGLSVQNGASATYTTSSLSNGKVVDVVVTNANECSATSTGITNTVNTLPTANAGTGGNVCDLIFKFNAVASIGAGTWTLTTGPGTATFAPDANTATATVTVSEYGTYTFKWTEVSGACSNSSTITVNFYQQPVANAGTGGNNCGLEFYLNGSINMGTGTWSKVSGPGNVTFSPNANTVNALVTVTAFGSYTFRWTVFNGTCSNSGTVAINFIQQAPANAGTGGHECDKDFIFNAVATTGTGTWTKISGPGNVVYTPDNHQTNSKVTIDQVGIYEFAWTVVNSICTSSDIVKVVFHDLPSLNAGTDTAICKSGSIQLHAQGTGSFVWVPAVSVSNPNISDPVAAPGITTTFTVTLTDQFGCKNSDNIIVEVRENPVANAGPDQVLEYLFEAMMDAELARDYETGNWSLISGTGEIFDTTYSKTSISGLSLDNNKFVWTVSNGVCPVSLDTITIIVNDLVIPTLITPNMDGKNDYFVLRGLSTLGKTELVIFDRRGARVYKNLDYDNKWDGVDYNNNPLADDTYFFVLKTENGKSISGYIVIRR